MARSARENTLFQVGILGGTFDPVHRGHLSIAEQVQQRAGLDRVIFVPCAEPPHKDRPVASGEDRYRMLQLAIEGKPSLEVSRMEIERGGKSYSVETMQEMRAHFGTQARLYFIIGTDAMKEIMSWKDAERLVRTCRFLLVARPGFPREEVDARYLERSRFIETRPSDISSTAIRQRVRDGQRIQGLVPASVEEYIRQRNLYAR